MMNKAKLVNFVLLLFYLVILYRVFVLNIYPSPPFYFDEKDSLMDYINTCFWTARDDRYTTWRSLYLPFSHFLCQIFNLFSGIPTENLFKFRNESKSILFLFFLAYSTQVYLLSRQLRTNFKCLRSALILIVFSTAVPILFAHREETYWFLASSFIAYFLLSSSNTLKILFAALAASIKRTFYYLASPNFL